MKKAAWRPTEAAEKELVKLIMDMSYSRPVWQTWQDMVAAAACAMFNQQCDRPK